MPNPSKISVAVLGATGYTGIECVRLLLRHSRVQIVALGTSKNFGKKLETLAPSLASHDLPPLQDMANFDWSNIDAVFSCLPHATLHRDIRLIPESVRVIDLSADFRIKNHDTFAQWYGESHASPDLSASTAYGLTELYRSEIAKTRIVACPGCYPTAVLLATLPLVKAGLISPQGMIIDAKSGISGAGRAAKLGSLFCESGESIKPYGLNGHRHIPEIEQELALFSNQPAQINFVPHLVPMSRGELVTIYAQLQESVSTGEVLQTLDNLYSDERFVQIVNGTNTASRLGYANAADVPPPSTVEVRGSNLCRIGAYNARLPSHVVLIASIDNLGKGSAGQAIQNFNVMYGIDETEGLETSGMFP